MKKKIMSLVLALVMCVGLAAPALAAPAPLLPDADAVEPRYIVRQDVYRHYLGLNTYANVLFTVSNKNGTFEFESVDDVSFDVTDPSVYHWQLAGYNYQLSSKVCVVNVTRREMNGNTYTGYTDKATITITLQDGAGRSGEDSFKLTTAPITCVIEEPHGFFVVSVGE